MADKREYEIKVEAKVEPVVQFVKALESANKSSKDWGEKLKDVIKIQREQTEQEKKNSQQRQKSLKLMDELHKSFETQYNSRVTNEAKMLTQSQKVADTISQINGLTEESYKLLTKNNQEKMTAVQSEIDALAKNAKSVEAVTKAYEKKKQAIEEQSAIARSEAEAAYNIQIEEAKKSGKDIISLEALKAEQIKRINDQLNKDLKKNAEEYTSSYNTIFKKLAGGLSDNMEVYMDTTTKKTKGKIQKVVKEAADLLGLEEKALEGVANGLLKTAAAEQKTAEAAKTATAEVKKTEEAAKGTAETAKAATEAVKKTGEEAAKTGESTKKIVDIDATRDNIKVMKQMLDSYRTDLKETGQATIRYYDDEIKAADNTEKRKELEAKKTEAVKFYGEQLVAVSQAITAAEKKEQDLGLLRWKQYTEKVQEVANSVKGVTGQISGALGSAFTAVSGIYKAEIASIEEDITHLKAKNAEVLQEADRQAKKITAMDAEQKNAEAAGLETKSNALKEALKEEKKIYQEQLEDKTRLKQKKENYKKKKPKNKKNRKK